MRISTTLIRPAGPAPSRSVQEAIDAMVVGGRRNARNTRHQVVKGFLTDPKRFDFIEPGLAQSEPGPRNDRLREIRYSVRRFGADQLRVHPILLHAALVAARIICWRRIHWPRFSGEL